MSDEFVMYLESCQSWLRRIISSNFRPYQGVTPDDIFQDVCDIAWRKYDPCRCANSHQFATFMRDIAKHRIVDEIRKQKANYRKTEITFSRLQGECEDIENILPCLASTEEVVLRKYGFTLEQNKRLSKVFARLHEMANGNRAARTTAAIVYTKLNSEIDGTPLLWIEIAQIHNVSETQVHRSWKMFQDEITKLARR